MRGRRRPGERGAPSRGPAGPGPAPPRWGAAPSPAALLAFRLQECPDPCCFAHNCSLRAGARCSRGDCCAGCQVRAWPAPGAGGGEEVLRAAPFSGPGGRPPSPRCALGPRRGPPCPPGPAVARSSPPVSLPRRHAATTAEAGGRAVPAGGGGLRPPGVLHGRLSPLSPGPAPPGRLALRRRPRLLPGRRVPHARAAVPAALGTW